MSSVGFTVAGNEREPDKLREAYNSLNDIIRGIESAQHSINALNFGMARDHLKAAAITLLMAGIVYAQRNGLHLQTPDHILVYRTRDSKQICSSIQTH